MKTIFVFLVFFVSALPVCFLSAATSISCEPDQAPADNHKSAADPNSFRIPDDTPLPEILTIIENAGNNLTSYQAEMDYRQEQFLTDTLILRDGRIYYLAQDHTVLARIYFSNYLQADIEDESKGQRIVFDEDYVFDGKWLHHRYARTKTLTSWEISRKAYNKETFRLGKGPFPLPFAIRKEDVSKNFEVRIREPQKSDPNNTVHLIFTPRKDSSFAEEYKNLELWIAKQNAMPVKIMYENVDYEITIVQWDEIILNRPIDKSVFVLKPAGPDWTREVHSLKEKDQ